MKFKFLKVGLASLILSVSGFANAGIISGTHTTDAGKSVDLQNLEWLTWDETYGESRDSIEAGYNGLLNDGWRYATRAEYGILVTSLWGGQEGYSNANYDGSQWLWKNFDNPDYLLQLGNSRTGDINVGTTTNYRGHWRAYGNNNQNGWFSSSYGVNESYCCTYTTTSTYSSSALVRSVNVPEPSTLAIFALGIIGLASRRFKKQS